MNHPTDPSQQSRTRLSKRKTQWLVIIFFLIALTMSVLATYVINRGREDPELQRRLEDIRRMITPGATQSSRNWMAPPNAVHFTNAGQA